MMHGAHVAAIGGTWLALAYGFAGLRDHEGGIAFNPVLSKAWSALKLVLTVRGQTVRIEIDRTSATYRLLSGDRLNFSHAGEECGPSSAEPVLTRPVAAARPDPQGFSDRH